MPCTGTVALEKSVYKINFIIYVNCSKNFKQNNHLHEISDFNTDLYYQNPDYIECSYKEGQLLA